jgi:hypothetical protein
MQTCVKIGKNVGASRYQEFTSRERISSYHEEILPYFSIDNARVIYTKRSKFVKNDHARYTVGMKKGKNLERLITATSQACF